MADDNIDMTNVLSGFKNHYVVDSNKIMQLLFNLGLSDMKIGHMSGLTRMTIFNIRTGRTQLRKVELQVAAKLTAVYNH